MANEELIRYIRENRDHYTRDAIRERLAAAGHPPEAVEAAFRASDAEQEAETGPASDLRPRATLLMVTAYVATWLVFYLFATLQGAAVVLGVFLVLGGAVSLLIIWVPKGLRRVTPQQATSALFGALIVPIAILLGLAGLCIATTNPFQRTTLF